MIDNYDSFTFNLVHYLQQLNVEVIVKKNDEISLPEIVQLAPTHIVISPGPCTPNEAGISLELIRCLKGKLPILGVCLGHQAIGQVFGATVIKAKKIMHGKTSNIQHNNVSVFKGIPQNFEATRYHSLVLEKETVPKELEVIAWTESKKGEVDAVMGVKHRDYNIVGIQFHPESILSEFGMELLKKFIDSN
jgi:anthranilate synthase component 2